MSTALATKSDNGAGPSQAIAVQIVETLAQLKAVRTYIKSEFVEGVDFGKIPGCGDKPTLLNPGAQKAIMFFDSRPGYRHKERDLGGGHVEFIVRCLLFSRRTREQIGEGIGCASTKEKKFKRGSAKKCPSCGNPTVKRSREEYGGGWYCDKKAGGCGASFAKGHKGLAEAAEVDSEDSIYEMHNTVLKMAKKRAFVDAAMTLGCLSELFTQDIEDTYNADQVRSAARPYEGEIIEAEVVETRPSGQPKPENVGYFTKASKERTAEFLAWMEKQCAKVNAKWHDEWEPRIDRMLEQLGEAPEVPDIINKFQFKGHLLKWAQDWKYLDPRIKLDNVRSHEAEMYLAKVFDEKRDEVKAELSDYLEEQRQKKEAAVYRKYPDIAPDGYFGDDQTDHGDAYDGPDIVAESYDSTDPSEAGKGA